MNSTNLEGLKFTEEEAYAILALALTSPQRLDATSERAIRKLAQYCTSKGYSKENHSQSGKTIHLSVS